MIATSCFNFILSTYFLLKNNPCLGKSLIEIDTDSLISSRFYTYAKLALTSGTFISIEFIAFDFIILASVYLDYQSMTSNVIILNILSTVWIFDYGIANLLTQQIGSYLGNMKKEISCLYIKYDIIIGSILTVVISIMTYIFAYSIPQLYVDDEVVINNVGLVLRWYSLFIYFDSAYHFINGAIKGIQKHSMINFVCSLILILIFIPLGLLFSFAFNYGYLGFWMSSFISMFSFCFLFGGYFYYLLKELEENISIKHGDIELIDNIFK
jgi:Na+-driven multidrug efflux pump